MGGWDAACRPGSRVSFRSASLARDTRVARAGKSAASILRQRELVEILLIAVLDVDLHGREDANDAVVEADGEHEIGQALMIEVAAKLGEGLVRDREIRRHLARGAQDRLGQRFEPGRAPGGLLAD